MSFAADCAGCIAGDHTTHDPEHGLVPGVIGGTRCDCSGDCSDRATERDENFARWLTENVLPRRRTLEAPVTEHTALRADLAELADRLLNMAKVSSIAVAGDAYDHAQQMIRALLAAHPVETSVCVGCCSSCDGLGVGGPASDSSTNGRCADCQATGHAGPDCPAPVETRGGKRVSEAQTFVRVLSEHTYVIDGPPAVIGVRCPCGFRNHGEYLTPERADLIARRHVVAELLAARPAPPAVVPEGDEVEALDCPTCFGYKVHAETCPALAARPTAAPSGEGAAETRAWQAEAAENGERIEREHWQKSAYALSETIERIVALVDHWATDPHALMGIKNVGEVVAHDIRAALAGSTEAEQ